MGLTNATVVRRGQSGWKPSDPQGKTGVRFNGQNWRVGQLESQFGAPSEHGEMALNRDRNDPLGHFKQPSGSRLELPGARLITRRGDAKNVPEHIITGPKEFTPTALNITTILALAGLANNFGTTGTRRTQESDPFENMNRRYRRLST